jgi:hypothetical protein
MRWLDLLLPPRHRAAFTDEFTIRDNPISTREARRDSRSRASVLAPALAALAMWAVYIGSAWLVTWLKQKGHLHSGIPGWAGGSYGMLLFVLFAGVHVLFVYHAAWRHVSTFYLREYSGNTLGLLLGTRTSPFQLTLQAAFYPFRKAMGIAAVGLPFYALVVSFGVPAADVAGLYVLFALLALRPPRWPVPVFAGVAPEQVPKIQKAGRPVTWPEWLMRNAFWLACAGYTTQGWFAWAFGGGWFQRLVAPLPGVLPLVGPLYYTAFISWPVLVARLLLTPLPFYGLSLPPVLYVVPFVLGGRLIGVWDTSIQLRIGTPYQARELWDVWAFGRMHALFNAFGLFVALGILWKPYVSSGTAASLLFVRGGGLSHAQAGLLWLLFGLSAVAVWGRAAAVAARIIATEASDPPSIPSDLSGSQWSIRARFVFLPLVTAIAVYCLGCSLADVSPIPGSVLAIAGPLCACVLSGGLAAIGFSRVLPRWWLPALVPFLGWLIPEPRIGAWIAAASPFTGILSLSAHAQRILTTLGATLGVRPLMPSWPTCCLMSAVVGFLLLRRQPRKAPGEVPRATRVIDAAIREMRGGQPALPLRHVVESPGARRLIESAQRLWDSAVMVKEMRVLFRRRFGRAEIVTYIVTLATMGFLLSYYPTDAIRILSAPAALFFGNGLSGVSVILGGLVGAAGCGAALFAPIAAASNAGKAFARERDRATLGFLLVTPLSHDEILWGKLLGLVSPILGTLAVLAALDLILAALLIPLIGPAAALLGFSAAALPPILLTFAGGLFGIICSTLFRKEADASSAGALVVVTLDIGLCVLVDTIYAIVIRSLNDAPLVFIIYVGTGCLVGLLLVLWPAGWALARWRVARARSGDIQMVGSMGAKVAARPIVRRTAMK